jgi:hypothetical protein
MPAEGDDGDIGRAAADVDNHVAGWLGNRQPGADRRGHGLLHEMHFAGLGAVRGILDGALFHLRDLGRHADDDPRAHPHVSVVRLLDEVREHLLGDVEVGDDAFAQRLDGDDVARRAAEHFLRAGANGFDLAGDLVDRHHRGLVDHDAAALGVDTRIGRAQIDGQIRREE